jgi:two-component system, NarL family, sensor histidine kinase UhpB
MTADTLVGNPAAITRSDIVKILIVLAAWQLLFWIPVHFAERFARPVTMDTQNTVRYQYMDANAAPIGTEFTARRWGATYEVREKSAAPRVRFLLSFELSDPTQVTALYLSVRNSIDQLRVNGYVAQTISEVPRLQGLVSAEPAFVALPSEQLRLGTNTLAIESPNFGAQWLSEYAIGPAAQLQSAFQWRRFLQTDIALAGIAVIAFTLLLLFVVRWPPEDRPRIASLTALLGVCGASTLLLTFTPPFGLSSEHVVFLFALFSLFIALASLAYVLVDGNLAPRVRAYLWPMAWAFTLLIGLAYYLASTIGPMRTWVPYTIHISFWVVIASVVFALFILSKTLVREAGARWFERSMIAFSMSAFALDRLSAIWKLHSPWDASLPITLGWSNIVGGLLGLSVVVALAREASEARRVVLSANDVLRAKLAKREAELSESYARESEVQKQAVLFAERQRLLRDMHDGIGGQLVSLQMQLRNQNLAQVDIEYAVSNSLNDLRLIVDALDDADFSLVDALLHFERRVRDQLKSSGIAFEAEELIQDSPQDLRSLALGPKATLHLLRILQEAISNAVRHAKPNKIQLRTELSPEQITFTLQDNGVGMLRSQADALTGKSGQGMHNMQGRASALGGLLSIGLADPEFARENPGCKLLLKLQTPAVGACLAA